MKNESEYPYLREALDSIKDRFAISIRELKKSKVDKHVIRTTDEVPIFQRPYRKSLKEREIIQNEVKTMIDNDIIEISTSPWSSPVVLIPKKDGSKRFCVDYRKLNQKTITETWPLPRIDDILTRLSGSKYFSTLDLISGNWQ